MCELSIGIVQGRSYCAGYTELVYRLISSTHGRMTFSGLSGGLLGLSGHYDPACILWPKADFEGHVSL